MENRVFALSNLCGTGKCNASGASDSKQACMILQIQFHTLPSVEKGGMRFGAKQCFALGSPLGDLPVVVRLNEDSVQLWNQRSGEVGRLHNHRRCRRRHRPHSAQAFPCAPNHACCTQLVRQFDLDTVIWCTALLPNKEHCLRLCAAPHGHELLLRSKSRARVEEAAQQLHAASQGRRQQQVAAETRPHHQKQLEEQEAAGLAGFGSPVAQGAAGGEEGSAADPGGQQQQAGGDTGKPEECDSPGGSQRRPPQPPLLCARSAPQSPVLPGLPLVSDDAGEAAAEAAGCARRAPASAPAIPQLCSGVTPWREAAAELEDMEDLAAPSPVTEAPALRLLSLSGLQLSNLAPAAAAVSHVQRLEAAVAALTHELSEVQTSSCGCIQPVQSPLVQPSGDAAASPVPIKQATASAAPQADAPEELVPQSAPSRSSSQQMQLLRESGLLQEQQAELLGELGRMQRQLAWAAAENLQLAGRAAAAVRQLQAAAVAAERSRAREQQLSASLAEATAQCEAMARELAALGGALDAREAQCRELRYAHVHLLFCTHPLMPFLSLLCHAASCAVGTAWTPWRKRG